MIIKRDTYLERLIAHKHDGMIKVVTGVRRCGKSYLLFELFCRHLQAYGVDNQHIIAIDMDDRRNADLCDPDALLRYIDGKMIGDDMYYILLDEVQNVREFESVLNSYMKVKNADVYVTGSNSRFLSKDIITEFRGRGFEIRIHPLSFGEYLSACEGKDRYQALEEYLTYGGLPYLLSLPHADEKREYLKQLFATTYIRDVKERNGIKYDADLEELLDVLASNVGSLTNPTKLANTFNSVKRSGISFNTIKSYIDHLQDAFLIERATRYDVKGKRLIDTQSKYYFEDLGLRNARLGFSKGDEGHLLENLLYCELRRRGFEVKVGQLSYNYKDERGNSKRSTLEVDFVCDRGPQRYYVQSALDLPTAEKREQEMKSLLMIKDSFPKILVVGGIAPSYTDSNGISIVNIFNFLLDDTGKYMR